MKFWNNPKIVFLNITSWIGSIGAEHHYGTLNCKDKKEPLTKKVSVIRKLSKVEAEVLCRKDGVKIYSTGSKTDRFKDVDALIRAAKVLYKKDFPKASYLIRTGGSLAIAEPQEVLIGPNKDELNNLFYSFDVLEWDRDEEEMERLLTEWEALIET